MRETQGMSETVIGVIGGSGVYHIDELEKGQILSASAVTVATCGVLFGTDDE